MITPETYSNTEYYLKFDDEYINISGSFDGYAVTKAGKVPLVLRNRDYSLQISTMTIQVYSITEILRGMDFKVIRDDRVLFYGFVDDLSFDEEKNEYSLTIAHEMKKLQRFNIRKSELDSELAIFSSYEYGYISCIALCKFLWEKILDRDIDFSLVENYANESEIWVVGSARFYIPMLWLIGLDYASSVIDTGDEDNTGNYWDVITATFSYLGLIMYFDGTKYVVKHLSQANNYDYDTIEFLDKGSKKSYIASKTFYNWVSFSMNASLTSNFLAYSQTSKTDLDNFQMSGNNYSNIDISNSPSNLYPYVEHLGSNFEACGQFSICTLKDKKEYIADYYTYKIITDIELTKNKCKSKYYDPIYDRMEVEQHEPYSFEIEEYYSISSSTGIKVSLGSESLKSSDSVYIKFTQKLSSLSENYIDVYLDGVKKSVGKSFVGETTLKLTFSGFANDSYQLRVYPGVLSKTLRPIFINPVLGFEYRGFNVVDSGGM